MAVRFAQFCALCEAVAREPRHLLKTHVLQRFVELHRLRQSPADLLGFLQLLLCAESNAVYRLKDRHLTKLFAKTIGADPQSLQDEVARSGDLPGALQKAFAHRYPDHSPSDLYLAEVISFLDQLSKTPPPKHGALLAELIPKRLGATEVRWLLKLIQKDLKLFIGPRVVLGALHSEAYSLYKRCSDLTQVVQWLTTQAESQTTAATLITSISSNPGNSASTSPSSPAVELLRPVQPMLAQAVKGLEPLEAVWARGDVLLAETKYDGERVQLHRAGDILAAFSRNLRPLASWKLYGLRDAVLQATARCPRVVLDGELLAADPATGRPLEFGTLGSQRFAQLAASGQAQLQLVVFDVLRLDPPGSLLTTTLLERRALLQRMLEPQPGRLLLSPARELRSAADVGAALEEAMSARHEGLMLKASRSVYAPGARHWFKLKRDYVDGLADSADLVVLGAYRGKGQRGGAAAAFLMGVWNPQTGRWSTVCKLGSGFDAAQLAAVQAAADLRELRRNEALPQWLDVHRALRPDWVVREPARAPVLEVRAAAYSASPLHTAPAPPRSSGAAAGSGGLSLRFPRLVRPRPDRSAADATSLAQLHRLACESARPSPLASRPKRSFAAACTPRSPTLSFALLRLKAVL